MRQVFLNCGSIAHMQNSLDEYMPSIESNVYSAGKAIVVNSSIIETIKDSTEVEEEFSGSNEVQLIDVQGRSIIPGLIDTHTHLLWAGDRTQEIRYRLEGKTYAEIEQMGGGIALTTSLTRSASREELIESGYVRLRTALSHGTTHIEAKSGYGLNAETELKLLDCGNVLSKSKHLPSIEQTWLGAHSFPNESTKEEYMDDLLSNQLPKIVDQGFAKSADVFCEPGWFSVEQSEDILRQSRKLGLELRMHIDEFEDGGGADLASELHVNTADHAYFTPHESRLRMKDSGVNTGCLPGAPFVLGQQMHDYSRLIKEEIPFTLATDFNPNCQFLSLPLIGSFAVQRSGLHPLKALKCMTSQAAQISNLDSQHSQGTIQEGRIATFNILNSPHWESWCQTPGHSPIHSTQLEGKYIVH